MMALGVVAVLGGVYSTSSQRWGSLAFSPPQPWALVASLRGGSGWSSAPKELLEPAHRPVSAAGTSRRVPAGGDGADREHAAIPESGPCGRAAPPPAGGGTSGPCGGSCTGGTGGTNGPCGSCPCALKFTVPKRELGAAPICSSPCESSGALALPFIACGGALGAWLR